VSTVVPNGFRIVLLRGRRNWLQANLADHAGVSPKKVWEIEHCRPVRADLLQRIADALNCETSPCSFTDLLKTDTSPCRPDRVAKDGGPKDGGKDGGPKVIDPPDPPLSPEIARLIKELRAQIDDAVTNVLRQFIVKAKANEPVRRADVDRSMAAGVRGNDGLASYLLRGLSKDERRVLLLRAGDASLDETARSVGCSDDALAKLRLAAGSRLVENAKYIRDHKV
jgi:transcriptional regulator with XRE-family HTH domain